MEQNTPEKVLCRAVHRSGIWTEGEEEGKEGEEGQTMEESEKIIEARSEGLTRDSGWPRLLSLHKYSGIYQHPLGF